MLIFGEFYRVSGQTSTKARFSATRARGRMGLRPKGTSDKAKRIALAAETLYKTGDHSVSEICGQLGISKPTLYNYLRSRGVEIGATNNT